MGACAAATGAGTPNEGAAGAASACAANGAVPPGPDGTATGPTGVGMPIGELIGESGSPRSPGGATSGPSTVRCAPPGIEARGGAGSALKAPAGVPLGGAWPERSGCAGHENAPADDIGTAGP